MKSILTILIILLCNHCFAQFTVHGNILDQSQGPVPYASVLLLYQTDSTMAKGQVSDAEGRFKIEVNEGGGYFVSISAIGYQKVETDVFNLSSSNANHVLKDLIANEDTRLLDDIIIKAERPFFEQKIDRTVINVKSNITAAGGTALDVLQKSPGVTVDRMNNRISLSGKQGVVVMINGKISRLPLEAVVQMLAGTNAEKIDRIELITTPPAKYEAQGDAGMINIVMDKSEDEGTNGSVSVFSGYGRKEKYGGSINVNHKTKRFSLFGDYSFRKDYTRQFFDSDRIVEINSEPISTVVENKRDALTAIHDAKFGFDWNVGNKTTIGGQLSFFDRRWDMDALANIRINGTITPSSSILMNTVEKNDWIFAVGTINLTHQFNAESTLSIDIDNLDYSATNPTDYFQDFFDNQNSLINQEQLRSAKETPINTWVSKIDYSGKINDKMNIEFGAKGSFSKLKNEIIVSNNSTGTWMTDPDLSSDANMHEDVLAGYVSSAIHASPKLDIQMGLRYEHTRTNLDTRAEANVVDRNFGNWFPSLFLNRKINDNNSWVLSYSRRIMRPSFQQIAPFIIFNDPKSLFSGNVSLLPSFTDAYKAEYRYKSILMSLQYSYDKNSITQFQPKVNADNKLVSTSENLDYLKNYSATLSFPIQITDRWETQFNFIGSYLMGRASFYDNPQEASTGNLSINGFQKFKLKRSYAVEVSGFWQSQQLWGITLMEPFGSINLGVEKKFTNSTLRLSYTDIFRMSTFAFSTVIPEENLNSYVFIDFEQTQIRLSYTLNFGNSKLKSRKKSSGSEEEQNRIRN